uniref:chitinase n=1 Tax=Paenibacillus sp. FPU-7 TaxID=762821 RepID=K7ZS15_9BACL|nr:chitinase [Paenibacillus sp. FPU-7]
MTQKKPLRKSAMVALSVTLAATITQYFAAPAPQAQAADSTNSYKVVGYYPAWGAYGRNYQVADMDVSKVTHINYAFADICWNGVHGNPDPTGPNPQTWSCQDEKGAISVPNGTIVLGDPWIDTQKSNPGDTWDEPLRGNLKQLIKKKQENPNLKTIISVGGWSWSNRFSDVAATAATREVFANSAVDFIRKYQFDGVDLDWEYPVGGGLAGNSYRPEDKQNYPLLLQKVREKLDAAGAQDNKKYLLTIASGAGPTYKNNNELGNVAKQLDWINIMTYDFNGGWQNVSAHNAPLYLDPAAAAAGVPEADSFNVEKGVQGHLDSGVPASKIVLGLPFYGRGWGGCANAANGQYQKCAGGATVGTWEKGSFDFYDLEANYINKNGYTRYWNDVAKVPYLYNPSGGTFISYDDVESLGYKTAFIKAKGLGGGMFWEFSGDRNKTLLNKVANDLQGPVVIDTQAPSVPAGLTVTAKTSNSVTLSWTASTDNVGVAGYTVSYGTNNVNVSGTSTTITGLTPNTAYSFTVKAKDAAGNVSAASTAVSVTTDAASNDTTAPTAPTNLQVAAKTASSITLNWTASTDNVGVTGYTVSYGTNKVDVTGTTATISGLTAGTAYTFSVTAKDAAGNVSAAATVQGTTDAGSACPNADWVATTAYTASQRVSYNGKVYEAKWWTQGDRPDANPTSGPWKLIGDCGTGNNTDTTAPSVPAGLAASNITTNSVVLNWTASTDNVGVTGYTVSYGTTNVDVTGTTATITGLAANTSYSFTVKAKDAAGNVSAASAAVTAKTLPAATTDTQAPTAPTSLQVTAKTANSVSLSWTASTDNVGVTGYTVSYGTTNVDVTGTTATINGLTASTAYTFTVKAKDAAGNVSPAASVSATTDAGTTTPGAQPWTAGVSYKAGDEVTYSGKTYICRQPHTSLQGWEPTNVASLWSVK